MSRIVQGKLFFSCLFILFFCLRCSNDDIKIDPQKALFGKWELVKQGISREDLTTVSPSYYTEFLTDSAYRTYDYNTKDFSMGDYAMNDSLLIFFYYAVENNEIVDTISVRYYYKFENSTKLLLEIDALALQKLFLYDKIK